MKKFLSIIFLIVTIVFCAFYFADYYITHNLYKSDARMFRNWNEVFFDSTYHDLIINGSSRAWVQYNPLIIDTIVGTNCYNLGLDGHRITTQIARYYTYLSTHQKPKYIIQNIDQFTILPSAKYEREQFIPYLCFDTLYNQIHNEEGYSWLDKNIPFIRYFGYKNVICEGLGLHNDLASVPLYKGFYGDNNRIWSSSIENMDEIGFDCDSTCSRIFERYLERCMNDSVLMILVYAPMYRGSLSKEASENEIKMYDYYSKLAKKYNCVILNYMRCDICVDKKYFYNVTHMNLSGANKFTKYLADDIDSLFLLH